MKFTFEEDADKLSPFVETVNLGPLILNAFLGLSIGKRNWSQAISCPIGINGSFSTVVTLKFTKYSVPACGFKLPTGTVNSLEAWGSMSKETLPERTTLLLAVTL